MANDDYEDNHNNNNYIGDSFDNSNPIMLMRRGTGGAGAGAVENGEDMGLLLNQLFSHIMQEGILTGGDVGVGGGGGGGAVDRNAGVADIGGYGDDNAGLQQATQVGFFLY